GGRSGVAGGGADVHVLFAVVDGLAEEARIAVGEIELGVFAEEPGLLLEVVRQPDIVGIEQSDQIAGGCPEPGVACSAEAAVFLLEINNAITIGLKNGFEFVRVRRAVVDDDDLKRPISLGKDGIEGLLNIRSGVVGGDDHAHEISRLIAGGFLINQIQAAQPFVALEVFMISFSILIQLPLWQMPSERESDFANRKQAEGTRDVVAGETLSSLSRTETQRQSILLCN